MKRISQPTRTNVRSGFTLIELLVAVTIAALLVAIAVPALKLNMRGQAVREAARQINSFVDEARSQAAASGRPFGVMIERDGNGIYGNPRRSYRLYHCETPPAYTGDLLPSSGNIDPRIRLGSRAYLTSWTANAGNRGGSGIAHLTYANVNQILPGDEISFGGSPVRYEVVRAQFDPSYTIQPRVTVAYRHATAPPPTTGSEVPPTDALPWDPTTMPPVTLGHGFRVYRQPVKIASSVLELPRSAAIDLNSSGIGGNGTQFANFNQGSGDARQYALNPIVIMFEPSGAVRNVTAPQFNAGTNRFSLQPEAVFEPIYLLVGRIDQVADAVGPIPDKPSNINDVESMWVSINPATGAVLTAENAGTFDQLATPPATAAEPVLYARQYVRYSSAAGG